jgi:hypothetical protein
MDFDPLIEGDRPQRLIDRLREIQAGVDDGWPFIRGAGRASYASTFPGSLWGASRHSSPAAFLLGQRAIVAINVGSLKNQFGSAAR